MALPIENIFSQFHQALKQNRRVILQAPPGAGKSTLLPLLLLKTGLYNPNFQIVMLEPRRVAAYQIATYLASQLGETVGQSVGLKMRGESKVSKNTVLTIVTDGTMVRQIQSDPELEHVGLILFDEFHERSLQADLALALALEVQDLNESLKLVVMSATLDLEQLSKELDAPIVASEGRQYPVDIHYVSAALIPSLEDIFSAIKLALTDQSSSILVFLPGISEIKRLQERLEPFESDNLECLPLYGGLSLKEQTKAIQPCSEGRRKVVLATNLAQTSLTIDGVDVVVDAGIEKQVEHDFDLAIDKLVTQPISIASATQRAGRAGRLRPGVCYRLGSKETFERRRAHDVAEIERANLAPTLMELALWGSRFEDLFWLSKPRENALNRAYEVLFELGFLKPERQQVRVTELGQAYGDLQLSLRACKMFFELQHRAFAKQGDWLPSAAKLASLLELNTRISGDLEHGFKTLSSKDKVQLEQTERRLLSKLGISSKPLQGGEPLAVILALTYPDRIASKQNKRWKMANGAQVGFAPNMSEPKSEFIVVSHLNSSGKGHFVQAYLPISRTVLEQYLPDLIVQKECLFWSDELQKPSKVANTQIGKLVLDSKPLPLELSDAQWQEIWCDYLRRNGLDSIGSNSDVHKQFCNRLELAQKHLPTIGWPLVNEGELLRTLETWLAPYLNGIKQLKQLKQLQISDILFTAMDWQMQKTLNEVCPEFYTTPAGNRARIDYGSETTKISVKLQEMFGQPASPTICGGTVPIAIELLSPAKRPLQITKDLAHFWQNGYVMVKKEMKGRYPKHPWPDDPLTAIATNKTKKALGQ